MQSKQINTGSKSAIYNDYKLLEQHILDLASSRLEISKTHNAMEKSINELNNKGFQDGNFENLHQVFTQNTNTIKKFEQILFKFENHCKELSQIIKNYYSVDV